ncbi:MAG: toll/interleukin-1 receptor domain-containing protein [Caldilineaceae bacterium]
MAEEQKVRYDADAVFISYSPEDIDWAEDELRPRLEASGVKVITGENLTGGVTVSLNRERAIADTRRTIVVLSPEWVANSWNSFEADMLLHLDPAAVKRKLLPVLLRKTEIPPRIARLTIRDLTDKKRYASRLAQLIRDVEDAVPLPPPDAFPNRWEWYWRQARRRGVTAKRGAAVAIGFLLLLLIAAQIWPFQPREVWLEQESVPGLAVLHNTGEMLVAGARHGGDDCPTGDVYRGLAFRPLQPESRWQPSRVPDDLLCVRALGSLTNIVDIGSHRDEPSVVYALTAQKGIAVSLDGGVSYQLFSAADRELAGNNEPEFLAVGGSAESPVLWVAGRNEGLWRVNGTHWQAVGGDDACPLPAGAAVDSLLVDGGRLLAGTVRQGLWLIEGARCTRVDAADTGDRWEYDQLAVASESQNRYVAVVRDREEEAQFRLVVLCPLTNDCETLPWPHSQPLWQDNSPVESLLVRPEPAGQVTWVLADQQGRVVMGDLNGITKRYPRITRCLLTCAMGLAWLPDGALYLLADPRSLRTRQLTEGRFYTYERGDWYRRIWP